MSRCNCRKMLHFFRLHSFIHPHKDSKWSYETKYVLKKTSGRRGQSSAWEPSWLVRWTERSAEVLLSVLCRRCRGRKRGRTELTGRERESCVFWAIAELLQVSSLSSVPSWTLTLQMNKNADLNSSAISPNATFAARLIQRNIREKLVVSA